MMKHLLESVLKQESLKREQARVLIGQIIAGDTPVEQVAALLIALRIKEETSEELLGFIDGLSDGVSFKADYGTLLDVCGTGGDGIGTFNVSTAVALVVASCGVLVAKHGNRGVSSRSGSADVLEVLGITSDTTEAEAKDSLAAHGLSFLFAPGFYPALKRIAQVRKNLGVYTFFNVLGPLLNPSPLTHQMMGVYEPRLLMKVAEVLKKRGMKNAFVVCGSDGLDELTLTGESHLYRLKDGNISGERVTPEDFGLKRAPIEAVIGGTPVENGKIIEAIFAGERSPKRDLVLMNAAAALCLVQKEKTFKDATLLAAQAIDSGKTAALLNQIRETGRGHS